MKTCEDRWRLTQSVVAASRVYGAALELAERAVAWLEALTPLERLRASGLQVAQSQ